MNINLGIKNTYFLLGGYCHKSFLYARVLPSVKSHSDTFTLKGQLY